MSLALDNACRTNSVADDVYHPMSAALIIGRQGRRCIYPDRHYGFYVFSYGLGLRLWLWLGLWLDLELPAKLRK